MRNKSPASNESDPRSVRLWGFYRCIRRLRGRTRRRPASASRPENCDVTLDTARSARDRPIGIKQCHDRIYRRLHLLPKLQPCRSGPGQHFGQSSRALRPEASWMPRSALGILAWRAGWLCLRPWTLEHRFLHSSSTNKRLELELAALGPFLADVDEDDDGTVRKAKLAFMERAFGRTWEAPAL